MRNLEFKNLVKYWTDAPALLETILSNFTQCLEPSATIIMRTPNRWSTIKMAKSNYLWLHRLMPCIDFVASSWVISGLSVLGVQTQSPRKYCLRQVTHGLFTFWICQYRTSKGLINEPVFFFSPPIRNILRGVGSRGVATILINLQDPRPCSRSNPHHFLIFPVSPRLTILSYLYHHAPSMIMIWVHKMVLLVPWTHAQNYMLKLHIIEACQISQPASFSWSFSLLVYQLMDEYNTQQLVLF